MDGSRYPLGKRSHSHYDSDPAERNGRQKRRNQNPYDRYAEPLKPPLEDVIFRVLCPGTKIGSVIGKGGSIIKALRHETGAKIKVADGIPGADERVILISTSPKDRRPLKDFKEDIDGLPDDESRPPAQEALFKVFSRIVDGESVPEDEDDTTRSVLIRLLVPNNQIGCLLGKGGKIIEQMRTDTGAQIRVLPREQLPRCAYDTDELVQLSGDHMVVRKALTAISSRLYENPPRDRPQGTPISFQDPSLLPAGGLLHHGAFFPQGNAGLGPGQMGGHLIGIAPPLGPGGGWPYGGHGIPMLHGIPGGHGGVVKDDIPEEELVVRLLCPNEKIGSVIGKGGNVIRHIRDETRARIKIADSVPNSDERVIIISSTEGLHDQVSPTLEAVLQLQSRIADLSLEKDGNTTTRLLVPSANIGCLLGKGGNIIADMRRNTRANIRVLPKESIPKCALDDDELVQVIGDLNIARDAVIEIVTRLRGNIFKEHMKNAGTRSAVLGLQGNVPVSGSGGYDNRHEPGSPGGMYSLSNLGSQGLRSSMACSPRPWGASAAGGMGALSYGGYNQSGVFGRSNGGLVASVAGTTIEISIPATVIGSIIGKGGCNIAEIRQISGAKVKLHDLKAGADKRVIEISGTPDQTQAAQSLLEAFMFTAQSQTPAGSGMF